MVTRFWGVLYWWIGGNCTHCRSCKASRVDRCRGSPTHDATCRFGFICRMISSDTIQPDYWSDFTDKLVIHCTHCHSCKASRVDRCRGTREHKARCRFGFLIEWLAAISFNQMFGVTSPINWWYIALTAAQAKHLESIAAEGHVSTTQDADLVFLWND